MVSEQNVRRGECAGGVSFQLRERAYDVRSANKVPSNNPLLAKANTSTTISTHDNSNGNYCQWRQARRLGMKKRHSGDAVKHINKNSFPANSFFLFFVFLSLRCIFVVNSSHILTKQIVNPLVCFNRTLGAATLKKKKTSLVVE